MENRGALIRKVTPMKCPHCQSELVMLATGSCPLCQQTVPVKIAQYGSRHRRLVKCCANCVYSGTDNEGTLRCQKTGETVYENNVCDEVIVKVVPE